MDNEAELRGGGLYCYRSSSPTVNGCSISNNIVHYYGTLTTGGPGGGVACSFDSSPYLLDCVISGNSTTRSSGGGLFGEGNCNFQLVNCIIRDNSAYGIGGAFKCEHESSPSLINCLLVNNSAGFEGAAIGLYGSSNAMITNCTIISNSITVGSAIQCVTNCSPTITNCILWNLAPDEFTIESSSPAVRYSNVQGGSGQPWFEPSCIDTDPSFSDSDGRLSAGSPCIDAGDNSAITATTDLDGNPRIVGLAVDMGAYEFQDPSQHAVAKTEQLIDEVVVLNLQQGIENSLDSKLDTVLKALDDVNDNNDIAAINSLQAFINAVEAQRGNKISNSDADTLIADAQQIIDLLLAG